MQAATQDRVIRSGLLLAILVLATLTVLLAPRVPAGVVLDPVTNLGLPGP